MTNIQQFNYENGTSSVDNGGRFSLPEHVTSKAVRQTFIDFFKSKGHTSVRPAPIVPANDPSLLFTNAGMNQFKDVFLGQGTRDYTRAADSQPCIRVSGKHNDLEDVGRDTSHLTMFEMLGNWSFGDYYKKEAISWAWELLTGVFGIPKEKLYITVYESDDESESLWKEVTDVDPSHVYRFGDKDNFWEMGETGPCGPCSEIHIDLGEGFGCVGSTEPGAWCGVNGDGGRFLEVWNLVFIQYERQKDGRLEPLPNTHVDTGMGLERLCAYLQGTTSAYMTDLFQPIIKQIEALSGKAYTDTLDGMSHRVMADHIRTLVMGIADNVMPSNDGRGYVLRRLLRRALRYAQLIGFKEPVLYKLVDVVVDSFADYYPHVQERRDFITQVVKSEEQSFLRTLESGLVLFEELAADMAEQGRTQIGGAEAFKLYDTYGFPLDLTQVLATEKGLSVDMAGFDTHLNAQREKSRKASKVHDASFTDVPKGGEARLVKTPEERINMARHHTGTHLIHEALRRVLGDHVFQAGSLVDIDHLRFDFTHFQQVSESEIKEIETIVNNKIKENLLVEASTMTLDQAKERGAMALFGEKYDEHNVRVISIGDFSLELCGGHHVSETSEIEVIKIVQESAVAAGTRRIEALAGTSNIQHYMDRLCDAVMSRLKAKVRKIEELTHQLELLESKGDRSASSFIPKGESTYAQLRVSEDEAIAYLKQLEKQVKQLKNQHAGQDVKEILAQTIPVPNSDLSYLILSVDHYDAAMLRSLSDNVLAAKPQTLVMLLSDVEGKGFVLVRTPKESAISAETLFKEITSITQGGGGGRPDFKQGGGADPARFEAAIDHMHRFFKG